MGWGFFCFVFGVNRFGDQRQAGLSSTAPSFKPAHKNTLHKNKHRTQLSKPPSLAIIFPCIWCLFFFFFNHICRSQPFPGPQSKVDSFHVTTQYRRHFLLGNFAVAFSFPFLPRAQKRKCAIFPVIKVSVFVFRLIGFIQTFVCVCVSPRPPLLCICKVAPSSNDKYPC